MPSNTTTSRSRWPRSDVEQRVAHREHRIDHRAGREHRDEQPEDEHHRTHDDGRDAQAGDGHRSSTSATTPATIRATTGAAVPTTQKITDRAFTPTGWGAG